ncbi:MAG: hypothetical protein ACIWVG_13550 [Gloeotrichia echinulata HAB0833]
MLSVRKPAKFLIDREPAQYTPCDARGVSFSRSIYGRLAVPRTEALERYAFFITLFSECIFMRIRTANGFGLVRPWSVLVIVLVLVMSGSAAFGQQKQSGQVKTSSKKSVTVLKQMPGKTRHDAAVPISGKDDTIMGEGKNDEPVPNDPPDYSRGWNPPMFVLPSPPGSGGGSIPGGGSAVPQDPPIMEERCISCSCPGDHAGPEFPDPNCSGLHKFYYEYVYTHAYDACAESQHTDLHICHSGSITAWKVTGTRYRYSNCSNVPDQSEPISKSGNNRTGTSASAAGVDSPLCRQ